jgi:hypothetical protein
MSESIHRDRVVEVQEVDLVLVPRHPTPAMLKAAFWDVHDEDAAGV